MADPDRWVVVGRLGSPFGVKGWNKLSSYTDPPENLFDYQPWRLSQSRAEPGQRRSGAADSAAADLTPRRIEQFRRHQGRWVVKLTGVDDRDAAALMAGRDIFADSSCFVEPPVDQYYWRDLVGMSVVNLQGETLGAVSSLLETPRHDVLVLDKQVAPQATDEQESNEPSDTLIPFIEQFVLSVDPLARIISVDWQADW